MKKALTLAMFFLQGTLAMAQWSTDPSENSFIMGTLKDISFPKIAMTPQGSYYISGWKEILNPDTSYNFWLQHISPDGYPLWGPDGIRISNQPCRTWLSDYSLESDAAGNAVIAFEDMRGGADASQVVAYSVAPDGSAVWNPNGVFIYTDPMDSVNSYSPMLGFTNSGNRLIAWDAGGYFGTDTTNWKSFIRIQKLSPSGALLWSEPIMVPDVDSTARFPKLFPVGADDFILCWQRRISTEIVGLGQQYWTYIYAQRFNSAGSTVWPEKAKICELTADSAQYLPEYFQIHPVQDPQQGLFISWFDDRYASNYWNIYTQHLDTAGNLQWPLNGIAVSTVNYGYNRVEPMMAYDSVSKDLYVVWDEDKPSGGLSRIGLVGQRFGEDGTRKWGDLGKVLVDYIMDTAWYVLTLKMTPSHDFILFGDRAYREIIGPDTVRFDQLFAMRIDPAGNTVWSPSHVLLATTQGTKYYPDITDLNNEMYVVSWGENRDAAFNPVGSVYAQNLKLDGNLGPVGIIPPESNVDTHVAVYPNPSHDQSWIQFSEAVSGKVEVSLFDPMGHEIRSFIQPPDFLKNSVLLDAKGLSAGIYYIRIQHDQQITTVKWIITREK